MLKDMRQNRDLNPGLSNSKPCYFRDTKLVPFYGPSPVISAEDAEAQDTGSGRAAVPAWEGFGSSTEGLGRTHYLGVILFFFPRITEPIFLKFLLSQGRLARLPSAQIVTQKTELTLTVCLSLSMIYLGHPVKWVRFPHLAHEDTKAQSG